MSMNRIAWSSKTWRILLAALTLALSLEGSALFAQTDLPPATPENAVNGHFGAELLGIIPGKTDLADLNNHPIFNKPEQKEVFGPYIVYAYRLTDLPQIPYIQVLSRKDRVEGVVIHLEKPRDIADARRSFASAIGDVRPIVVPDDKGNFREIYPEKGFAFVLEKNADLPSIPSNRVTQIITETVKADFFAIRGAHDLKKSFAVSSLTAIRKDAETALEIDPDSASAHWIIAQIAFMLEEYKTARERIIEAIRLDDSIAQYHFLLLNILYETGRIEDGLRYLEAVKPICDKPPFFRAELGILRGDFFRAQQTPDIDGAIREHRAAVDLLLPFVKNETKETRILAKRLLMRAYLSLAADIVQKEWPKPEDREKAFLWIDAASEIANSLVRDDLLSSDVLLELCVGAVWVAVRMPESTKGDFYLEKIGPLGDVLTKNCSDPLNLQYVYWKCGKGLFGAYRIAEERGEQDRALGFAFESLRYLEPFCDETPRKVLSVLGPIDYDFAMLFAKKKNLRSETLVCRQRAVRVIEEAVESNSAFHNGENGVRLVNLGKAYWTDGDREQGFELTGRGIELIEQAVAEDAFAPEELIVPLRNAALMAMKLERTDESQKYDARLLEIEPAAPIAEEKPTAEPEQPAAEPNTEEPAQEESIAEPSPESPPN